MRRLLVRANNYIIEPQNIVITFMVTMLIPNMVLALTEPYSIPTIIASILLPAGLYIALTMIRPRPAVMILWAIPLMILCAFQLVISYLFGNSVIAIDMFTNVFTTNATEAGELLGNIYPAVIIVIVIYIPMIVFAILSVLGKQKFTKRQRTHGATLGLVLIMLGFGFAGISKIRNPNFSIKYHIFPVNVSYNIGQSVKRWNKSMNYPELSKDFVFGASKEWSDSTGREIYVMVIGEASRAMSWSLYGYERQTNEHLSKRADNMVVFRDLLTQSNTTHKSVPIMMSPCSAEDFDDIYYRKSIIAMFKEAGFRTAFLSSQPANRSLTQFFSGQADTLVNIAPQNLLGSSEHYDIEIVPALQGIIDSTDESMFVVIHTYGSHATHHKRYTADFAKFQPDFVSQVNRANRENIRNAYDNTIVYTDYVLDEIISAVDRINAKSAILYCADHGEDIMDDNRDRFLHASPTTTYYQLHVAAFTWFSDSYQNIHPERVTATRGNSSKPATTASVFHTLGNIADIECDYIDKSNSLANSQWKSRPRMYINDYNRAVNVLETGLHGVDIQLFDKHKVEYNPADLKHELF